MHHLIQYKGKNTNDWLPSDISPRFTLCFPLKDQLLQEFEASNQSETQKSYRYAYSLWSVYKYPGRNC